MSVLSGIDVYTLIDQAGNPRTQGWFDFEFQENYVTGGVYADLSPHFSVVRDVRLQFASGALHYTPEVNLSTLGTPASVLIQLFWVGSGVITVNSGMAISVLSGAAMLSGLWTTNAASGFLQANVSGFTHGAKALTEVANATAVSGSRARLLVMGY